MNPGMNPETLVPKCGPKIYLLLYQMILFLEKLNLLKKNGTYAKISQLVASLQTSRQQVVFARLVVTSCQQVWNKLLTTCNKHVHIIRIVTRLFQQGCYSHDITILLQPCVVNLVTFLLFHNCIRLVGNNLVTSLIMPSSLLQVVNNLFQTCHNKPGTSSANTTC